MTQPQISGKTVVLADYLSGYKPVSCFTEGVQLKTTDEIISELSSLVDLDINDVADTMAAAGFHTHHGDGRHGWMMKPL